MAENAKKGLWASIFGTEKSGCCGVRIEEVTEVEAQIPNKANAGVGENSSASQVAAATSQPRPTRSGSKCCG
jgi:hypothetical protein